MTREARTWVWDKAPTDNPLQLLILLSLADVTDEDGGNASPSKSRLARDSRSNERTVQRHLASMVETGILEIEQKATQHRPTTYGMTMFRMARGDTGETQGRQSVSPGVAKGDALGVLSPIALEALKDLKTKTSEMVADDIPTTPDARLCEHLAQRIAEHASSPLLRVSPVWLKNMRLLRERGPSEWAKPVAIPAEQIDIAIDFVFDYLNEPGRGGFCWADQIRSPGALRVQWTKLRQAKKTVSLSDRSYVSPHGYRVHT